MEGNFKVLSEVFRTASWWNSFRRGQFVTGLSCKNAKRIPSMLSLYKECSEHVSFFWRHLAIL